MENSNNKQNQDKDKDKDIKKDYTIETMDHNTAEESSDQQINAKLEKKPLYKRRNFQLGVGGGIIFLILIILILIIRIMVVLLFLKLILELVVLF